MNQMEISKLNFYLHDIGAPIRFNLDNSRNAHLSLNNTKYIDSFILNLDDRIIKEIETFVEVNFGYKITWNNTHSTMWRSYTGE